MTGRIYLLDGDGNLEPMIETPYEAEALLQRLLADYPDLLAGDQMNAADPRRWVLVRRESPVPDSDTSGGRWSLDHLFLDQESVPTLVEVKRSSDTRVRREVVAQMLDYTANATSYWSVDQLQQDFADRCAVEGHDPDALLRELVGDDTPAEEFWQRVKANLLAGRVRLVFVADIIPKELIRIVEFLNEQMDPAEVLAVEVRQFVGEGNATLVPRVLGQTAKAAATKAATHGGRSWDLESTMEDLAQRKGTHAVDVAHRFHEWARSRSAAMSWGRGSKHGSFALSVDIAGESYPLFLVSSEGHVEIGLPRLGKRSPYSDPDLLLEFVDRLNGVESVSIESDLSRWPRVQLVGFPDGSTVDAFLAVWDWYVDTTWDWADRGQSR